jgi:glycosyltransferase involved in cell wall biosynthesis
MEHFVVRLAGAQRQKGSDAAILALHDGPLHEEARQFGLPVTVLGGSHKLLRVPRAAGFFLSQKPQIIHAHNQTSLHYAVLGKRVCKAPTVMTNHGQGLGSSRTPSADEWSQTDSVIAVSNAVADKMDRGVLGKKLETIYNGVTFAPPARSRAQVRQELGLAENRVVGIIVARIDDFKGHETLITALSELKAQGLPLTMLVAGDGARRAAREQQAATLGLGPEQVRFLGFRSDVPDFLAAADFFTLPSLTEGLPLSVLEAMSHGLPTVATAVGGIPELVTEGVHGRLVPVKDSAALAAAFQEVSTHPELRQSWGAAARHRVETEFSFERMTNDYMQLYQRLLAR